MHWWRWRYLGCTDDPPKKNCIIEGCTRPYYATGLCQYHRNISYRDSGYKRKSSMTAKSRFSQSKFYAKDRHLVWEIPYEIFCELISTPCTYCDELIPSTKTGLDRINNNLGYTLDNVVPCCKYCNSIKSDKFTVEEFKEFSKLEMFKNIRTRLKQGLNQGNNSAPRSQNNSKNLTDEFNIGNMNLNRN